MHRLIFQPSIAGSICRWLVFLVRRSCAEEGMKLSIGRRCSYYRYLLAIVLLVSMAFAHAATESVTVSGLPGVKVDASVIVSGPGSVDMPDREDQRWQPLIQPLGTGFGDQVHWVRLVIHVPQALLNSPMVLRFQPPNARDVQFSLPDGKVLTLEPEGSFEERMLGFPDLATSFVASSRTILIHVRLATAGRIFGTFELMSERSYYQSVAQKTALNGALYGMLLLVLSVNLLNWVTSRQGIYGLYVGFVAFSMLASLAVNGYLHALLPTTWSSWHGNIQIWLFAAMTATAITFAARIIRLQAWSHWLKKVADRFSVLLVLISFTAVFWVQIRPYVWEFVLLTFLAYGVGALTASALHLGKNRSRQGVLLALAFLVFAVSQWISIGAVFGVFPATPVNLGMWQFGLVVHLVLLQMALAINSRQNRWHDWQQQARLETLKCQADAEARRSRDLQRFLERLTHEFKTPLAVIDSSVQSLGMLEQQPDPQRDLRYERIRRAVTRLNDLLMRSVIAEKDAADQVHGKRELVDLTVLLQVAIAEFTSIEIESGRDVRIRLELDIESGRSNSRWLRLIWKGKDRSEPWLIAADVGWLHVAIHHVFDNALKYSVGDDEIVASFEKTSSVVAEPQVVISITNRCDVAMGEADLSKLFDKYYRKGEQSNVPGAGVGLYVARQAAQAHGGTLIARLLKPGQIQFCMTLPLAGARPLI